LIPISLVCALLVSSCADPGQPGRSAPDRRPIGPRTIAPANRPALDAAAALEAVRASIVTVESLDRRRNVVTQGSGVIVADKTVVTAWPLVSRAFAIRVRHEGRASPATVSAVLEAAGLVRLSTVAKSPIEFGRDTLPTPGARVYSIGASQGFELTFAEGVVAASSAGKPGPGERIETTASSSAGFTGGALLDTRGALIGILASSRAGDTASLAVPVRHVKDLLALPAGTLPRVTSSPLLRLAAADRQWLVDFMTKVARGRQPLEGLGLDRVNALLDRLDPLVGAELDWVKRELGLGLLDHQRLFWEDAIESRTFGRAVKSSRRLASEKELIAIRILSPGDAAESDAFMRAIAAHEPFDTPGARIDATEGYLSQMMIQVDKTKRRVETQLWEARSR
jgi:S1-C subfamily serine protease